MTEANDRPLDIARRLAEGEESPAEAAAISKRAARIRTAYQLPATAGTLF